jgi:hypothetical protein
LGDPYDTPGRRRRGLRMHLRDLRTKVRKRFRTVFRTALGKFRIKRRILRITHLSLLPERLELREA